MNEHSYNDTLAALCAADDRIIVMTAENRAPIRGLDDTDARFIDVGIAEQTLVGMAAGLALRGRIPIVHALSAFLTMRAFEFIRTDVGIANLPVKLVGFIPGVLSDGNGPTHQAIEDIALMSLIPGMTICCPADSRELAEALRAVVAMSGPAYIRYLVGDPLPGPHTPFLPGVAHRFGDGTDVVILTYGHLTREAIRAAAIVESCGVSCAVINVRTVVPIDESTIHTVIADSGLVVTLEDHRLIGGLYSIVTDLCVKYGHNPDVLPISLGAGWFTPGRLPDVLAFHSLDGAGIARRIIGALDLEPATPDTELMSVSTL